MSEFISLYSGSSGNCSVVRTGEKYIIIDMGKGVRTTSAALKELGLNISDCAGILVTHEHSDHVKGLATFLKKNPLPVYGADDTLDFLDANGIVPASCELRTDQGTVNGLRRKQHQNQCRCTFQEQTLLHYPRWRHTLS